MKLIPVIFFGLFLMVSCTVAEDMQMGPESGIVKTDAGYISGTNETGIRAYLGIPYAAPPTRDLR